MTRALLAIVVATAGVTTVVTHHHPRRSAPVQSAVRVPADPHLPRASRASKRQPLPRHTAPQPHAPRQRPRLTLNSTWLDVTAYCATGSRTASGLWPHAGMAAGNRWPFGTVLHIDGYGDVTIEDRIGWGSDVDLYFGDSPDCEQRASDFGRQRRRVAVAS